MFIKKILLTTISLNTIGCLVAFMVAPWVVPLILGESFTTSIQLFQWMLIVAFLHLPGSMIGYPVLGALGYEKTANRSVIFGSMIHIVLILICYQQISTPLQFVWIMIISQSIIVGIRATKLIRIRAL